LLSPDTLKKTNPCFTDHSITQAAALVKAKHHIQKFRIKRKSPPAASNIVLLRKIPKGQDQKLKQNLAKNNRENNRREQNKKKQEQNSEVDKRLSFTGRIPQRGDGIR